MRSSVLITAPTIEPITLAEFKLWARIDGSDEDTLISNLITAARQEVEKYLRSAIMTQTWELILDLQSSGLDNKLNDGVYDLPITALYGALPNVIELPYSPIQSITFAKYYDLSDTLNTFNSSNYTLDSAGGRFMLDYGAAYPSDMRKNASFVIRYVAGYADSSDVPFAIKTAIMNLAQGFYESRSICSNGESHIDKMKMSLSSFRKISL